MALARTRALGNRAISHHAVLQASVHAGLEIYPTTLIRRRKRTIEEAIEAVEISHFQKTRDKSRDKKRGKVGGFSQKSNFRLLQKLGRVGRYDPPFMLTVNYRSGAPEANDCKRHLDNLTKWLRREHGGAGIWRLEETTGKGKRAKDRTPHFHILVWNGGWHDFSQPDLEHLRDQIAMKWCKITEDVDEDRLKYGVNLKSSNGDVTRMKNYLVGHTRKKSEQDACNKGRHWGIFNALELQLGQARETLTLTPTQRAVYDRITAKLIATRGKGKRKARNLGPVRETHLVLDPWQQGRLMRYIETIQ